MKTKISFVLLIAMITVSSSVFSQGFQPPSPGKAVIYFARVTKYGYKVSFEFFHQDKYIGIFKGKNYLRYECDPGQQLLWASSENKEFITCDLKEGGSYIVIVDMIMGAWKGRVGFTPITAEDERFIRAKELIDEQAPVVTPQKKIDEMNKKLAKFIPEQLQKYNDIWKGEKNFKHISPDMAIPAEAMK
jgi:hypothetical protein